MKSKKPKQQKPLTEIARQYLFELSRSIDHIKYEVEDLRRTIWALQENLDYSPPENPYDTVPF